MKLFFLLASLFFTLDKVSSSLPNYQAIFNFGDSLSDTGNFLLSGANGSQVVGKLPYGEAFLHGPTGRYSDGRLIVDFIAEVSKLPHLPPYLSLKKDQDFHQGVNFAVAGATALEPEFLSKMGAMMATNYTLSAQLGWFKELKASLCITKEECEKYFKKALFLVGEIGGNDYNFGFNAGGSIKQLKALVPLVVDAVIRAINVLIEEGAVELVVPGNLPIGCLAVYLTFKESPNKDDYDKRNGCLKAYNGFSKYHNKELKRALATLQQKYPHAWIRYADYYGAVMPIFHAPQHYGFRTGSLDVCCGGGGRYNFNNSARCGDIGFKVCNDPSSYANWDGIHLTEAAYGHIAKALIHGNFTTSV